MKQKTHSGTKKRVKVKGRGKNLKLTFAKAAKRHLLVNKSKRQKSISTVKVHASDTRAIKKLLKK